VEAAGERSSKTVETLVPAKKAGKAPNRSAAWWAADLQMGS